MVVAVALSFAATESVPENVVVATACAVPADGALTSMRTVTVEPLGSDAMSQVSWDAVFEQVPALAVTPVTVTPVTVAPVTGTVSRTSPELGPRFWMVAV